jgi:glycosyltransferase involved in cell wall biosynthesis
MIYLFIHQNFPAQYRHLVRHLADQPENQVYFITQPNQNEMPGVHKQVYTPDLPGVVGCHPYVVAFDVAVRTGLAVLRCCRELRESGVRPDIVLGHCGWGETLFVKDAFPDAPLLSYFEFFYRPAGVDVGFDPEFAPAAEDDGARLRVRNAVNWLTFEKSDWGHAPTQWQKSLYPPAMQARISALHEGIDCQRVRPDRRAWLKLRRGDLVLTKSDEVVTYVARNLEPYRGFHIFMRALPTLLRRRPRAHVLIAGGDGVSYGNPPPPGTTFRGLLLREVGDALDMSRVHFLGQVPYEVYLNILQVSSVHVYLTYPFVLSWSFLEAMAAGCLVVASATAPVLEVLRDGRNGLAVDFFSIARICDRIDEALDHPDRMRAARRAARAMVVREFDFRTRALPRWLELLDRVAGRRHQQWGDEPSGLAAPSDRRYVRRPARLGGSA